MESEDPITVTAILTAAGTAAGVVGKYQSGKSESNLLEEQGRLAQLEAKDRAEQSLKQDRRIMAKARAGYGASGVSIEGSPLQLLTEQALDAELKARKIRWSGMAENKMRRWAASNVMRNTYWSMGSSILGGASQSYGQFSQANTGATK